MLWSSDYTERMLLLWGRYWLKQLLSYIFNEDWLKLDDG